MEVGVKNEKESSPETPIFKSKVILYLAVVFIWKSVVVFLLKKKSI